MTEQIERITHMEKRLDFVQKRLNALEKALDGYEKALPVLSELTAYYDSGLWRKDYSDDEAGLLPGDLKRGVLSEDAVYNLIADAAALRERMRALTGAE